MKNDLALLLAPDGHEARRKLAKVLQPAPIGFTPQEMDQRARAGHDCVLCGGVADQAFVWTSAWGLRWFDVCIGCGNEVRGKVYRSRGEGTTQP